MALLNCKRCGKLFESDKNILCKKCSEELDDPYTKIRNYLLHHRGANMMQVSEATGVSKSLILKYMREGKLETLEKKGTDF